jgi:phosphonopyruvate decarboxylase
MLSPKTFLELLQKSGIEFFAGVPDSLLKPLCAQLSDRGGASNHLICANEGAAVAVGIGHHLATGKIPMVYMQNSGIGNAVNPLISLADPDVYSIPMLLVIGWRGEPGKKDEPQHKKQGRITEAMLQSMEIGYLTLDPSMDSAEDAVAHAVSCMKEKQAPFAFLIKKGTFQSLPTGNSAAADDAAADEDNYELTREKAIEMIVDVLGEDDIVVSTTGMASRELFEIREKIGHPHTRDFLTVGGMGHASTIALGIAMHKVGRRVFCIDGDGAVIMHMGSMAVAGDKNPGNFHHLVINNGAYDSVGGQPTVAFSIRLTEAAEAMGYRNILFADTREKLSTGLKALIGEKGPSFLEIRVKKGARSDLGRPTRTPLENKTDFMEFLR